MLAETLNMNVILAGEIFAEKGFGYDRATCAKGCAFNGDAEEILISTARRYGGL